VQMLIAAFRRGRIEPVAPHDPGSALCRLWRDPPGLPTRRAALINYGALSAAPKMVFIKFLTASISSWLMVWPIFG
jgi:hypothetical protein